MTIGKNESWDTQYFHKLSIGRSSFKFFLSQIVEVSPKSTAELTVGTRLCAYWSQQYRCLYPGSAAEPGTPDPHLDAKFVSVEFDDGDSGRIALQDIRLLPPNYPVMGNDSKPPTTHFSHNQQFCSRIRPQSAFEPIEAKTQNVVQRLDGRKAPSRTSS